jgi:glycosyltransferase involved in cell wall biosynthesis
MSKDKDTSVLIINDDKPYLLDFIGYIAENCPRIKISELPSVPSINKRFYSKKKMILQFCINLFYFMFNPGVYNGRKFDSVLLNGILIVIPYLFLTKFVSFAKPKKHIIVAFFFLHNMGEKRFIQRMLKFLLDDKKVILTIHAKSELNYFLKVVGLTKAKIEYFPYCQDVPAVDDTCGKGKKYIFTGGNSNRDYECLLKAAKNVNHDFIVACSELNDIPHELPNVKILRNLSVDAFHGYLKNSTLVVIPLKHDTGSSGQAVILAAMSFNKAVICTDIESLSEYITPDVTGITYNKGNAVELAEKINLLLTDQQKRNKMEEEAYKEYDQSFRKINSYKFFVSLFEAKKLQQ